MGRGKKEKETEEIKVEEQEIKEEFKEVEEEKPVSEEKKEEVIKEEPTPVVEPVYEKPKKKKIGVKVVSIILPIIIIIGIAALFVLPNIFISNKMIIEREITAIFNEANRLVSDTDNSMIKFDFEKESLGFDGTLKIESNYKDSQYDLSKLKNYSINYSGVIDKKNNEASVKVGLDRKSNNIMEILSYVSGRKTTLSLGDIYSKAITTISDREIKDIDIPNTFDATDIRTLLEKTERVVKDNVKEEDIKKTNVDKKINGKNGKYTKVEYKLNVSELEKKVLESYKKDDEVIKILGKMLEEDNDEVKAILDEQIDSIGNTKNGPVLTINVYLEGILNNVKCFEIIGDTESFIIDIDNDIYNYRYEVNKEKVLFGKYNDKDRSFTLESEAGLSLKSTEKNRETKIIEFKYEANGQSIKINAEVTNKVGKKDQTIDAIIDVTYNNGKDDITAKLTNNLKITKGAKAEKVEKNGTIELEDINQNDYNKISRRIYDKLEEFIEEVMPGYKNYPTYTY